MVPPLQTLRNNGVRIEADPREITPLPEYAEELRDLLLSFEKILPMRERLQLQMFCKEDRHIEENAFPLNSNIYFDSGHRAYKARWEDALNLRDFSKQLSSRQREDTWTGLMSNHVFQNINQQSSDHGIILRDMLSWGTDELFTQAVDIRGLLSDDLPHQPKPDYWFGLGLYNDDQLSRLKGLELFEPGVEFFTQENLTNLSSTYLDSFICQPVPKSEGAGFPWMLVECKREGYDEQECLRQAANGCHTVLEYYEKLAAVAENDNLPRGRRPPIIALTSIGPKVKIFIAHRSVRPRRSGVYTYRMSCIWEGNVEHILQAVQLRRIMDQLMFWALRIFKPWVTDCLKFWYERAEAEGTDDETGDEDSDDESNRGSEDGHRDRTTPLSTPPARSRRAPGSSPAARSRS